MKKKINILIFGSAGYLGASLINSLPDRFSVICFDRVICSKKDYNNQNIDKIYVSDISSKKNLKSALLHADIVFYRAGITGGTESIDFNQAKKYIQENFENLILVLNYAAKANIKKFIFDSTEQIFDEFIKKNYEYDVEPDPYNFYGLSKLLAEKYLIQWQKKNKISVDIFRYSRIVSNDTVEVIHHMVNDALNKGSLTIYGNPKHAISFIHLSDVIRANLRSIDQCDKKISIYNITNSKPITLEDLSSKVIKNISTKKKFMLKKRSIMLILSQLL